MIKRLPKHLIRFFINSTSCLDIAENKILLTDTGNLEDPVNIALKKFESHPSIIDIKEKVSVETKFSFGKVGIRDIELEVGNLKTKKASTFMNIPVRHMKQVIEIIVEPLMQIWNNEIVDGHKFPTTLKCADIAPIFKKLDRILLKNYRPVSILPVVSKIFEKIMEKQMKFYISSCLLICVATVRDIMHSMLSLQWKKSLHNK